VDGTALFAPPPLLSPSLRRPYRVIVLCHFLTRWFAMIHHIISHKSVGTIFANVDTGWRQRSATPLTLYFNGQPTKTTRFFSKKRSVRIERSVQNYVIIRELGEYRYDIEEEIQNTTTR